MALSENGSDMVMPVQPLYGNNGGFGGYGYPVAYPVAPYYGGNNSGFGGGDWGSWIIIFLFAMMFGGFGGGFGMGGFGGMNGMYGMFPWLLASNANSDNIVQGGFNQAATASTLAGLQNSITTGFSNAEVASCNRAMDAMQTAYGNQIASMNQSFANSQALDSRLDSLNMGLQNCCCENRASIADLNYTVAQEACDDRAAVNTALRDVLTANTASTQRILDQLCADKIDAKNEKIADLERQLTMANLAASQVAQTARIETNNSVTADALYTRLTQCPIPSQPVYGSQPIFTCPNNNNGCGCGCGGNNF